VLVEEIVTLFGLEVQRRKVAYGNLNPKEATAIFIRSALVEENVMPPRNSRRKDALISDGKNSQSLLASAANLCSRRHRCTRRQRRDCRHFVAFAVHKLHGNLNAGKPMIASEIDGFLGVLKIESIVRVGRPIP